MVIHISRFIMSSVWIALFSWVGIISSRAQGLPSFDIHWHELGIDENSSMPLGNGDIALNAWTEQTGDVVLLISKSDSWSENAQLLKIGRLRIKMTPNPFVGRSDFLQSLRIDNGSLQIKSGKNLLSIWVDANDPVIHISAFMEHPVILRVNNEVWRQRKRHLTSQQLHANLSNRESRSIPAGIDLLPDTVLPAQRNSMAWCHYNAQSMYDLVLTQEHLGSLVGKYKDPLKGRCFGAFVEGDHLHSINDRSLRSDQPYRKYSVNVCVMTAQTKTVGEWYAMIEKQAKSVKRKSWDTAWKKHQEWWRDFWNRSWIKLSGTNGADSIYKGYVVNRYMTACAGRGPYPMKFNGSLFTVGHDMPDDSIQTIDHHDPDFRHWGGDYWNQNTRHLYYPLFATGDYDMMMPWFDMYVNALPLAKDRTRLYFHHGGASFMETILFWGLPDLTDFGWDNPTNDPQNGYVRYYTQGALEVVNQMLDYYDHTENQQFLQEKLLPFAEAILTFYREHWPIGKDGKILFSPSQSLETYQENAVDPTPDIAGLWTVTDRLLKLPSSSMTSSQVHLWTSLRKVLPSIPLGFKKDERGNMLPVILPARSYGKTFNSENPELYAVFPYRNYGIGKPDLQRAINTYQVRKYPFNQCWGQDGMQAALLGLTQEAQSAVTKAMTTYGKQKFPWFWAQVADYTPDMDNGGTGMMTLQLMLMQVEGKKIRLMPSWPSDWNADFKLHAPYQTIIEGRIEHGKLCRLKVSPQERMSDVIIGDH